MEKTCLCCKRRFKAHPAVRISGIVASLTVRRHARESGSKRSCKGQRLPGEPGFGSEAVAEPKQGLLEAVPQEESSLHREKSYWSKRAQPAEAIRVRDCKDGRAKGKPLIPSGRYRLVPLCNPGIAKMDELIVELELFRGLWFWGVKVVIAKRGLAGLWMRVGISFLRMKEPCSIEEIAVSEIGEKYGVYRIVSPGRMRRWSNRYGSTGRSRRWCV